MPICLHMKEDNNNNKKINKINYYNLKPINEACRGKNINVKENQKLYFTNINVKPTNINYYNHQGNLQTSNIF